MKKNSSKTFILCLITIGTSLGLYNSLVINDESIVGIENISFNKRLDEILGRSVEGRTPASEVTTLRNPARELISHDVIIEKKIIETEKTNPEPLIETVPPNIIDSLNLKLFQIISKQDPQELITENIQGNIVVQNGVIESLTVTFQDGESLNLESLSLNANRFEYNYGGEVFYGMFYHTDEHHYIVKFTNGPFGNYQLIFKKE